MRIPPFRWAIGAGICAAAIGCLLVVGLSGTAVAQSEASLFGQNGTIVLDDDQDDPITIPECDATDPQPDEAPEDVEWEETCVQIDAAIQEDGTWTADPDDVTFPLITDTDPSAPASEASVQFSAPEGLEGTYNDTTGELTIEGPLAVEASIEAPLGLGDDCQTTTTLNATTGESGELTGTPLADSQATVVDNTFEVPAFAEDSRTCGAAADEYGLPSESGESYFELVVLVEAE
ncbi:MAG: cell surface glycoprotein [Natrialbaceae archaeon]|nr:cell surface glycoprotein [Natrialbaceae archaeon]